MANSVTVPRSLIIFGICIPLALLVGYLMATPFEMTSFVTVGMTLGVLCLPLLMHFHYPLLIFSWNAYLTIFFLPGEPSLWMLMAGVSLGFTVLSRILNKEARLINVTSVTWSLILLTLVVAVTAKLTGGVSLRSMGGGTYGGKKFYFVLAAIVGYFALSSVRIRPEKALRYAGLFFLAGISSAAANLIYFAGEWFYWLYLFFPVDFALSQATEDYLGGNFPRLVGVTFAGMAALSFMMARYGIRGILEFSKPWRPLLVLLVLVSSLLGGFRSLAALFVMVLGMQFYFEGLFRTRLFLGLSLVVVLALAILLPIVDRLPLSMQRSLSFLPVEVHPAVRADSRASTEWRLQMWQVLLPSVPKYFFLGKGYALNPSDLYLAQEAIKRGLAEDYEMSLIAGDYHSGALSILIPFGIFGFLAFLFFLGASVRVLYRNYLYGDPVLKTINTFMLGYFLARVVFYFLLFGSFHSDMAIFVGLIGFNVALNGGISQPRPVLEPAEAEAESAGFAEASPPAA